MTNRPTSASWSLATWGTQRATPEIENGNVLLPKQAHWLPDYVQELTTFPKAKYDDQVDSTAQALRWITDEGREPRIITYYKQECERLGIVIPGLD